jgi:hypothetical protein
MASSSALIQLGYEEQAMKIRVMPDYNCYPLWKVGPTGVENVDPRELAISASLAKELLDWADVYDATLRRDDPASSGFSSSEAEISFENDGVRLWKALINELGESSEVTYFSQLKREEIPAP